MHKRQNCFSQNHTFSDFSSPTTSTFTLWHSKKIPWWPCLNLCHNILSFAMNSGVACVFSVQNLIIAPIADARLPLDGTYRKCCDRGPMTGKEIKLVCEYINVFPSTKTVSAELKIVPYRGKLDPIDFSLVIWTSNENVFIYLPNSQKVLYHKGDDFI